MQINMRMENVKKRSLLCGTRLAKFSIVGGIGVLVQLSVLWFLTGGLHWNYLFATVAAVEAAVVHNFLWHERFTWADRGGLGGRASLRRFAAFNLSNGAISILGNVLLMKVQVDFLQVNYLAANGIAIVACSAGNFLVSDWWVFAG